MEVELGVKVTKTRDDVTSISDFQFAKDRAGPLFLSKQTDTKFILTAYLKGLLFIFFFFFFSPLALRILLFFSFSF